MKFKSMQNTNNFNEKSIKLDEFSKLLYYINENILSELIIKLEHIDDFLIFTYMKAIPLIRIKQLMKKIYNDMSLYNSLTIQYKKIFEQDLKRAFNIDNADFVIAMSDYFDNSCELIEKMYNSDLYKNFYEFEEVNNIIFQYIITLINEKNNTKLNFSIKPYSITFSFAIKVLEDIVIDKNIIEN